MEHVTFPHLDELAAPHLGQLIGRTIDARDRLVPHSPRVASLFGALLRVLEDEQARRQAAALPHSAGSVTVALPMAAELSDAERRDVMRFLLETQSTIGGGSPAAKSFCAAVLGTLSAGQQHHQDVLGRLAHDMEAPSADERRSERRAR